ncbi:MAG: glucose-1-phosphate cytidylyltransferase [Oscillospiraceae bacterium]|jgi:glucose-1-phosphate cytidylyltransferase|nr:glucose-1-phosphate cytidylyltransferase [Oscillospiraceae bacterium]
MKTVILAGGQGPRIAEEGNPRPKPMVEIGGQPILWHIMKYYSYFGFNEFIICCGYKGYMIKEYFADYYLHRSDVTFDFTADNKMTVHTNAAEPWKVTLVDTGQQTMTGGRIKRVQKYVGGEPFMMTYGDGVSDINLNELLEFHRKENRAITISAVQPGGRYGLIDFGQEGYVRGFREKSTEDGGWINAGFMVMQPEIFNYLSDDNCTLEFEPFEKLSQENKMSAYRHYNFWKCMDTQRDRGILEEHWKNGDAPWKVWE